MYASWPAEAAASDFVGRLAEAGRRAQRATVSGEEPTIFVILDGENAWEYFESGGRPFLRALYRHLSSHPELRTVTMADACRGATRTLTGIFPGSWIDANFYIWIGHPDDQRAWSQLAEAREALESPGEVDATAVSRAREEIFIAEGSDWFWWYGDDHSSEHDLEFDDLFRRHLRNVYRLLQKSVPDELFVSNISSGSPSPGYGEPVALLTPRIDGEETSYFEWLGAGTFEVVQVAGTMHQTSRRPALLTFIRFGFDRDRLYVRLDGSAEMSQLLADGRAFWLTFLQPDGLRIVVRQTTTGAVEATLWARTADGQAWSERRGDFEVAAGSVLELAVPFVELGVVPGSVVGFFVTVRDVNNAELERHPPYRPLDLKRPDAQFDARNWIA
jgi:hypothetical protein